VRKSLLFWEVKMCLLISLFSLLIAKGCYRTGSLTYRECWEATMGTRGGLAVALVRTLLPAQGMSTTPQNNSVVRPSSDSIRLVRGYLVCHCTEPNDEKLVGIGSY
jgi:hypothetical protein